MPSFRNLFPGVNPVTLVASILYIPPFIRDISCWAGFRQVSDVATHCIACSAGASATPPVLVMACIDVCLCHPLLWQATSWVGTLSTFCELDIGLDTSQAQQWFLW
jgi:hypothetical protein